MKSIIFLKPYIQETIWGGKQLADYGYVLPYENNGEAWTISAIKDKSSTVKDLNVKLNQFYLENQEFFNNYNKPYPLLVKIIDAHDDLSIQVHPDDNYAQKKHNCYGKAECWYVLNTKKDNSIVYGHHARSLQELKNMVENKEWNNLLLEQSIEKGDFIYVAPGTVHAIKKNTLIYEIQQSSDITYRLYDYNRLQNNALRPLHIEDSLNVIYCPQNNLTIEKTDNSSLIHELINNEYFKVVKLNVEGNHGFLFEDAHWVQATVIEGKGYVDDNFVKKGDNFLVAHNHEFLIKTEGMKIIISYVQKK